MTNNRVLQEQCINKTFGYQVKRRLWISLVLAALALTPAASGVAQQAELTFSLVGTHQDAAAQPTEWGQRLAELEPWQGKLYLGYGDYGANTGPISVAAFDPKTSSFSREWVSDTEAIYNYRPIQGFLYAPAIDRRQNADYARSNPWKDYLPIGTTHAYDIVKFSGQDLWLVGSFGYDAAAWRSSDGGSTWKLAFTVPPRTSFARFYFAGVYGGKLYLQAVDYDGGPHPTSKVFDGKTWANGPSLLPAPEDIGWRPQTFAGKLVYSSRGAGTGGRSRLMTFDGAAASQALPGLVIDFHVTGDRLFALAADGQIFVTRDLQSWQRMGVAPAGSWTIALLDGFVYIGGSDAQLFRSNQRFS